MESRARCVGEVGVGEWSLSQCFEVGVRNNKRQQQTPVEQELPNELVGELNSPTHQQFSTCLRSWTPFPWHPHAHDDMIQHLIILFTVTSCNHVPYVMQMLQIHIEKAAES